MKRHMLFIATAVAAAFSAPAFAQVDHRRIDVDHHTEGMLAETKPLQYDRRPTAWIDNKAKHFGAELTAKWMRMKARTLKAIRRPSHQYHFAPTPAWA